uniref:Protein kinase domain-containing protein n=1 Tax=Kalanchoe fedtschenkoi TaxID=63787 RepID=A0A7N0UFD8_KALFE
MSLLSHPNILEAHCSFTVGQELWVVMPFMSGGSLQSIITSAFRDGLPETCIAVVLKETLSALSYLHDQGHLHRDIKAGNILIGANGSVKLADFGVSASVYESVMSRGGSSVGFLSTSSSMRLTDLAGTPYWMAPEVIHSHVGYSYKADIWSFGITALELARGRPPLSHLPPSKSLLEKLTKKFRFSDYENGGPRKQYKFSKAFKDMVRSCLEHDPAKRPTAEKLLRHSFFRNCKGAEVVKNLLQGLPSVEERFKASRLTRGGSASKSSTETEDDSDEGFLSENVMKQRRISGWNFNEDGLELEPLFPSETEADEDRDDRMVKQVRFGGETIIQDLLDSPPCQSDAPPPDESATSVAKELMIPPLRRLQQSLEVQKEMLISMIQLLGGRVREDGQELTTEEHLERAVQLSVEAVEALTKELDDEKQRTSELEKQLEELGLSQRQDSPSASSNDVAD